MLPLAHFTPAELPGTVTIFLLGIAAGWALALRSRAWIPLSGMAAFAFLGYLADTAAWPESVKLAIDVTFLGLGVSLVGRYLFRSLRRS